MSSTQVLIYKVLGGLLALICTVLLVLEVSPLMPFNFSHALGIQRTGLAQGCTQPAEENKHSVPMIFKETPDLEHLSSEDYSGPKSATVKPELGILWVQRNETYKQGWGISMFHALHCLKMIRDDLGDKASHQVHGIQGRSAGKGDSGRHRENHVQHCFSYIAQAITCAGDGTIEPPWEETDASGNIKKYGVDGEGYQHECRETRQLWEAVLQSEKHAVKPWDWQMGDTVENINFRSQD